MKIKKRTPPKLSEQAHLIQKMNIYKNFMRGVQRIGMKKKFDDKIIKAQLVSGFILKDEIF